MSFTLRPWTCSSILIVGKLFPPSSQNLQAQKTDNQQIKVKLRRLEEDNAKREKQIEELLDPTRVDEHRQCLRVERRNCLWTTVFLSRRPSTLAAWWIRKVKAAWWVRPASGAATTGNHVRCSLTFTLSRFSMGWSKGSWSWNSSAGRKKMLWGEAHFTLSLVDVFKLWKLYLFIDLFSTFLAFFVQQTTKRAPDDRRGGAEDHRRGLLWRGNKAVVSTSKKEKQRSLLTLKVHEPEQTHCYESYNKRLLEQNWNSCHFSDVSVCSARSRGWGCFWQRQRRGMLPQYWFSSFFPVCLHVPVQIPGPYRMTAALSLSVLSQTDTEYFIGSLHMLEWLELLSPPTEVLFVQQHSSAFFSKTGWVQVEYLVHWYRPDTR